MMMRFGAFLMIGATLAVLGALAFGEMLAQFYPDDGTTVFLAYYAVQICACVCAWVLAWRDDKPFFRLQSSAKYCRCIRTNQRKIAPYINCPRRRIVNGKRKRFPKAMSAWRISV